MIDFPIAERLDERICLIWLERQLHPDGCACPHCQRPERRLFRQQGDFPAYRCRACDGYYTLLTHTVFAKTRQRPSHAGTPAARYGERRTHRALSPRVGDVRKQLHTVPQLVQTHLNRTAPAAVTTGTTFEADERYQNAGKKRTPPSRSQ
jgi:hypothetical protein